MAYRILLRRDTKENWEYNNTVLMDGEPGVERGTKRMKIGDGSTPWNDLNYIEGITGPTGPTGPTATGYIDNITDIWGTTKIEHIVTLTQGEYDSIESKNEYTLYIIVNIER